MQSREVFIAAGLCVIIALTNLATQAEGGSRPFSIFRASNSHCRPGQLVYFDDCNRCSCETPPACTRKDCIRPGEQVQYI
ncbi:unnamed protein product [Allacma fusca]|uniref:Pacifastin domain-containing protein n=1 Tax=Allacma fusca TaxID=39272 RepID=A0A8J2KVM3_9HEXA|nr:unnamed protein product [Allacma fusca]